jgi:hypothetical protein
MYLEIDWQGKRIQGSLIGSKKGKKKGETEDYSVMMTQ